MNKYIVLISFFLIAFINNSQSQKNKPIEIIILHTNDMHAKIDNFGKLAYLYDSLKKSHPYVFLVAAGDNFTGNPIVDMYPEIGYPMIDLMNKVGYVASAIGNHEFDMGQINQNNRRKQANFPFLCANIDASHSVLKQPKPYIILKAGKIKLPILSFIQINERGLPDSHPMRLEGLKFTHAMDKAKDFLWLKKKYGILIGLTHLGIETDVPFANKYPQFDVIIGGHSHTLMLRPNMVNNVMIVQAGSGLKSVGKTTLIVEGNKIIDKSYELIVLSKIDKTKPEVQALIDKYNDNEEMNKTVGIALNPIEGEDELGSLMTDAITHQFGVDIAFQNNGGIRIPLIKKGNIPLKELLQLDPFGNQVVLYTLSVAEIKSLILNAFNRSNNIDIQVSGIKYTVIVDKTGSGIDVEINDLGGKRLDESKEYKVGMNSFIASSYNFDHRDVGAATDKTSVQTLLEYIKNVKEVDYAGIKRTYIKPIE